MIVINKTNPEGRVFTYHKVSENHLDLALKTLTIIIKSWVTEEEAVRQAPSYVLFATDVVFDNWDGTLLGDTETLALAGTWYPYSNSLVKIIPPIFAEIKAKKAKDISNSCYQEIVAGFTSNALGAPHLYPANDRDQANLSGTILRSTLPSAQPTDIYPFLCKDSVDVWDYRPHSAAQIQQVGTEAYNAILAARYKNSLLQNQIEAATTQLELDAIVW